MISSCDTISVGARQSSLSKAQVQEVLEEIRAFHPSVVFVPHYVKTYGDQDRTTSLRTLAKTDFFTKEVDDLVLQGICRVGIHSAKDLPDPLPKGLACIALTAGVDPSDSLVLRKGVSLMDLPLGATIATSSIRREESVRQLNRVSSSSKEFSFVDIRGTIEERLELLDSGKVDGVVIAEAALIRLKLTHRNRISLSGETPPLQGRLALLARVEDREMRELFSCLHAGS